MRNTRYTNAQRVQRREERGQRVQAGQPSARQDYRCLLCKKWFSTYRNRPAIHRASCEKKREGDRARTPLPPQNQFIPEPSGPSSPTSVLLSTAGGSERAQQTLDGHILDIAFQQPKDVFHAPSNTSNGVSVLDKVQVLLAAGDHDPMITALDEEVYLQQDPGEPEAAGLGAGGSAVQDPTVWPLELGQVELDGPPDKSFEFYFLENVVRSVHITVHQR